MSRVLLTGASGFVGRHALPALSAAGHEIHAVSSRKRVSPDRGGVRWHDVDLHQPDTAARLIADVQPEVLLHLAWYAEHGKFWTSVENVRWVETTLRLLRAFVEGGGRRAVMAGSCAEYDWSDGVCSERGTPTRPTTLYGASKLATSIAAMSYGHEEGVPIAWGRIFFLYGPYESPGRLVPSVTTALLEGRVAEVTSAEQVRDFMHVSDVGAAFAALVDSPVEGEVNIGTGSGVQLRSLIEELARTVGRPDLVRFGALPDRPGDPPQLVADARRLTDEVGFRPRVGLAEGLEQTVAWWRARLQ